MSLLYVGNCGPQIEKGGYIFFVYHRLASGISKASVNQVFAKDLSFGSKDANNSCCMSFGNFFNLQKSIFRTKKSFD